MFSIYSITFSIYLILRYNSFQSEYYDLGLQLYSLNSVSNDFGKVVPLILPSNDSLIGHLNPFMLFVLPIYWLSSNPINLLILTSIAFGASVFPFFLLAKHHLKNKNISIILSGIYLINPIFHNSNRYDFHLIAFVPLFIFGALYFFENQKILSYFILILLANSTHEFMTIITCSMALSLLITECKNKKDQFENKSHLNKKILTLLLTIAIGVIWFFVASLIQSYFNPSAGITNWATFGGAQDSQLPQKIVYFIQLFSPLLFLPLLKISWVIPVLPFLLVVLVSNHPGYWTIYYQYGAFTMPFLFCSIIFVFKRVLANQSSFLSKKRFKTILMLLLISNFVFSVGFSSLSPFSEINWPSVTKHDQILDEIIENIPKNSSVITQSQIYPHLADRSGVALYLDDFNLGGRVIDSYPDFLAFDVTKSSFYIPTSLYGFPINKSLPLSKSIYNLIVEGNYTIHSAADGAYLFVRDSKEAFVDTIKYSLFEIDESWITHGNYTQIDFGLSISGNKNQSAFFVNSEHFVQNDYYSLSYGMQTTKSYGLDSWAGVLIGYKDPNNYLCLCLRYPGGFLGLISVEDGISNEKIIGSITYPSEDYQYFYLKIEKNTLNVYVNSHKITKLILDSSALKGQLGYATWQQDTNIHLFLLTEN